MNRLLHHTIKEIEHFFAVLADNNTPERKESYQDQLEERSKQTTNDPGKYTNKPVSKH